MGTGAVTNQVEWAQWSSVLNQEVDEIPASVQVIHLFTYFWTWNWLWGYPAW